MANFIQRFSNFFIPSLFDFGKNPGVDSVAGPEVNQDQNLNKYILPVNNDRRRQDIATWRQAIKSAELGYFATRSQMQAIYDDTILNGHVYACMERRRDLSVLREFEVMTGKTKSDILTDQFRAQWFSSFIQYALDAKFFGYSLIALGDCVNSEFPHIQLVKRRNISPDRFTVSAIDASTGGALFLEDPYRLHHVWVPTANELGNKNCGYGLLYNVAYYEIIIKNLMGYNGDFVQTFAMPYRVGSTEKTSQEERDNFAALLSNMASAGWALKDTNDTIEFMESSLGGTGYRSYDNLELRCKKDISKLILGHADALDSIPGKLGASHGEESPTMLAMYDKQTKDGNFIEHSINTDLFPRLEEMGVIPKGCTFKFKNNKEIEETRHKEDTNNAVMAQVALQMSQAGLQIDPSYFSQRTGIPCTIIAATEPPKQETSNSKVILNALNKLYA